MKLRAKLVLLCVIAIATTLGALAIYDAVARHRAASELMIDIVQQHLDGARERCEADPAGWSARRPAHRGPGGPPPPPGHDAKRPPPHDPGRPPGGDHRRPQPLEMWAYDASFRSAAADAPTLPTALTDAITDADVAGSDVAWRGDEVAALVRTPWGTGPCAYVFARGSTGDWGAVLPPGRLWLLPSVIVLGAALLVAGPLVRRIRRLTREVEQSASAGYTLGVDERGADEVGELSRAFATASRRIRAELDDRERRERALREFLANTTHDLMIPLTVLQGHLAALRDGATGPDAAAGPDAVRSAMNEAHYMASLVHNLGAAATLDVADAVVHRAPVDLREVVARVAARHRPIAREAGITLDEAVPDAPVLADADVTLVEQAISNLTYNAVRYNHRGGHVAVIVEVAPPGRFCVRVIDDGPGIAEADLARVLARGGRSDAARSRAPEGQGLGLHIALGVAALHGFTLELGAAEGGGLEACLRGPCRPIA